MRANTSTLSSRAQVGLWKRNALRVSSRSPVDAHPMPLYAPNSTPVVVFPTRIAGPRLSTNRWKAAADQPSRVASYARARGRDSSRVPGSTVRRSAAVSASSSGTATATPPSGSSSYRGGLKRSKRLARSGATRERWELASPARERHTTGSG
eukprot:EG_transcript_13454